MAQNTAEFQEETIENCTENTTKINIDNLKRMNKQNQKEEGKKATSKATQDRESEFEGMIPQKEEIENIENKVVDELNEKHAEYIQISFIS